MPGKHSAGILLYRKKKDDDGGFQVLLVKPGGPFWTNKHEHELGVVKGEFDPSTEDALDVAKREWKEETGSQAPPESSLALLGRFVTSGRKTVHVYTAESGFIEK